MNNSKLSLNITYYILYRLINVLYPLVTVTYVSRKLGPENIGNLSFVQTVVIFLSACASLGLSVYGTREISKSKTLLERSNAFFELFFINFISTLIIAVTYYLSIDYLSQKTNINIYLFAIYGLIILLNFINIDWLYQGLEDFEYITKRSFLIKLISVLLIYCFINTRDDVYAFAVIFVMAYVGNYVFNVWNLRKNISWTINKIEVKKHLIPIASLALISISNEIYVAIDTIVLGFFSNSIAIAYYSNAMKIVKIVVSICTAMGVALLPRLVKLLQDGNTIEFKRIMKLSIRILIWFSTACSTGLLMISRELVIVIFGYEFESTYNVINIISCIIIFKSLSNLFLQILLSINMEKRTSYIYCFVIFISISINLLLVPKYSAQGAALSSAICEFIILTFLLNALKKELSIEIDKHFIIKSTIPLVVMVIGLYLASTLNMPPFYMLCFKVLLGICLFIFCNIIIKNEIIYYLLKLVQRR